MSDLPPCDPAVFEYGEVMCILDVPKDEAEKYCQDRTKLTGLKHDWHYVGGRVVVKALPLLPKLQGSGRDARASTSITFYFTEPLTDNQFRQLENHIKQITEPRP